MSHTAHTWHDIFIITCLLICPIVNTQSPLKPGGFTNMYVWTEKSLILNLYRSKCLIFALQLGSSIGVENRKDLYIFFYIRFVPNIKFCNSSKFSCWYFNTN